MCWDDYFLYKKDGSLVWKKSKGAAKIGNTAGNLSPYGYIDIRFNTKLYGAHRIIWEMLKGKIPKGIQIDHINGKRKDNRIENLRLVTSGENKKNAARRSDNTSGVTGVYWMKSRNRWMTEIQVEGKKTHLGQFKNKEDAIKIRKEAEKEYGYHKNHGRAVLI